MTERSHRSGFIGIIGLPNAGKSTLMNFILDQKLSIVSSKPQTTRNRIMGIHSTENDQFVFIDTPGIHRPQGKLHRVMVKNAQDVIPEVDVICWVVDVKPLTERVRRKKQIVFGGILHLLNLVSDASIPKICILNKADIVKKQDLLPIIMEFSKQLENVEFVPISAKTGDGVSGLLDVIRSKLPEQPPIFPKHQITDVSEKFMISELIREKIFHLTNQEVPYSIAVEVEHMVERDDDNTPYHQRDGMGLSTEEVVQDTQEEQIQEEQIQEEQRQEDNQSIIDAFLNQPTHVEEENKRNLIDIFVRVWVERDSQKGIVIGKGGARLKEIATRAREDIEKMLGTKVFMDIQVSVLSKWSDDPRKLKQLGYK
jgi:GTPase